jgi:hypothetical protein
VYAKRWAWGLNQRGVEDRRRVRGAEERWWLVSDEVADQGDEPDGKAGVARLRWWLAGGDGGVGLVDFVGDYEAQVH